MSYELTDEEISEVLNSKFGTDHERFIMVAKAAQEKLRDYYLNMTDEELREKLYMVLYELVKTFGEGLKPGKGSIKVKPYIDQILSLVIPHTIERLLERIEGIVSPYNPYQDFPPLTVFEYIEKANSGVFNEAIQTFIKVIKEVE